MTADASEAAAAPSESSSFDPIIGIDAQGHVAQHRLPVIADRDIFESDDRGGQFPAAAERKRRDSAFGDACNRLHPREHFQAALRLFRL